MPGLGAIPVQEVADAVQAIGYGGPACLELFLSRNTGECLLIM